MKDNRKTPVYPLANVGMVSPSEFMDIVRQYNWQSYIVRSENEDHLNTAVAFDTEATTFFTKDGETINATEYSEKNGEERRDYEPGACTYVWMFGLCGLVCYGRTLEEFVAFTEELTEFFRKENDGCYLTLVVYVHNLAYDFAFFHKYFKFEKVFSLERRKPLTAKTERCLEFRCSYLLTGVSLEKLAEKCTKYHASKMVGDLDYNQIRHPGTPLDTTELKYCENDVRVIMNYITEQIEKEGKITRIPLTKTGYVRRECREKCMTDPAYVRMIKRLKLDPKEYEMLKQAFAGGFTHANPWHREEVCENVQSMDFTSSYPAVMVSEYFPMSSARRIDVEDMTAQEFRTYLRTMCCLMTVEFDKIESRFQFEHYISKSRTDEKALRNAIVDNGRIVEAECVCMTITEKDLEVIKYNYKITGMRVTAMYVYKRGYLPTNLVQCVLRFYQGKTTLKGVKGQEEEYQLLKEYVNSVYGMMVTDIVRDDIIYADDWQENQKPDLATKIEKYNRNKKRFTFYPWGVWITSHARFNLWTGIFALGPDYIYSDTDSVKYMNPENHAEYFKEYNKKVEEKMLEAMKWHQIDAKAWRPTTIKGEEKPLGFWDFDGSYARFKTLGAKKYMVEDKAGKIGITVAGVGKKSGAEFFQKCADPFKAFETGTVIGPKDCGKLLHQYIIGETETDLTDYLGNVYHVKQRDGVALSPIGYEIGDGKILDLLAQIWED